MGFNSGFKELKSKLNLAIVTYKTDQNNATNLNK